MLQVGQRVQKLTKKVGQASPSGKIEAKKSGDSVEVLWDDGHRSIVTATSLEPERNTAER